MRNFIVLLSFGILLTACGGNDTVSLSGTWSNGAQTFNFEPDNKATWVFNMPHGDSLTADTFHITYAYDTIPDRAVLDLSGFQSGPLKGRTLFGIVKFRGDTLMEYNSESAPSSTDAESVRPIGWDPVQTQVYRKLD